MIRAVVPRSSPNLEHLPAGSVCSVPGRDGRVASAGRARAMTIVCGLDAGGGSRRLLGIAAALAERLAARLVVLHVAPPAVIPGASAVPGAAEELSAVELERGHRLLLELCESERRAAPAERRVALGSPATLIAAVADEERADLIVVGSRGRGRLAAAFLGSVSARLSRSAPCPVVVVPPTSGARPEVVAGADELAREPSGRSWP